MNVMSRTLGEALQEQREALGYSQREAAAAVGVSQATWNKWEHNINKPDADKLDALATFLGIDYDDIVALWTQAGVTYLLQQERIASLERLVDARDAELDELRARLNAVVRNRRATGGDEDA